MKIITFKLFEDIYLRSYLFDEKALLLSSFLMADVGPCGESFKKFINSPDRETTTSNYCYLAKYEGNVLVGCQFDEDPYENGIEMPQKELVSIIDQWDNLIRQRPQEIFVFKEGDTYRLEGHGFPDKQQ